MLSKRQRAGLGRGGRTGPAYAATKGGGIALTKGLAKDLGADGMYVNAGAVVHLASNASNYVTGQALILGGGLT